jgi:tRNA(adenine34) deaminase
LDNAVANQMLLHESYMRRCLGLAAQARATGDAPVGALIVRDGQILAEGVERVRANVDVTAHAEIDAIRRAAQVVGTTDLTGATLYTTVEPCVMCAYALREVHISLVVFGATTTVPGGTGTLYRLLTDAKVAGWPPPPQVIGGILADDCAQVRAARK